MCRLRTVRNINAPNFLHHPVVEMPDMQEPTYSLAMNAAITAMAPATTTDAKA
jgi:hypothetical protein